MTKITAPITALLYFILSLNFKNINIVASVKFNLKYKNRPKSPIFMCVYYGAFKKAINQTTGKEYQKTVYLKYYISESVEVKYWMPKECRVKKTNAYNEGRDINARLNEIEKKTISVIRNLQLNNIDLGNEVIKIELDNIFRAYKDKTNKISGTDLMSFITQFIEGCTRSDGTKKSYNRVLADLKEYQQAKSFRLTFERINIDFHNEFILFLQSKGYAPNTIGTRIKVLKTFMSEAYERGLHNNLDFKKKSFNKPSEETYSIYLNEDELDRLYKLDLSKDKKLSNVRDWFLIASYTGLRFSDFSRLTQKNIINDSITIKTQKTGVTVVVPLHTIVKSILESHKYELPKVISNQKFNEYIKTICEKAKIDDAVLVNETKGTMKKTTNERKYKLVSAHTARRSFATNAFLAGVSPIQIMKITGHKTEKAFLGYIKISGKENAKKLQLHPFFNRMIIK